MDNLLLSNEEEVFSSVWSRVSARQTALSPDCTPELPLQEQLAGLAVGTARLRQRYNALRIRFAQHRFSHTFTQMYKDHSAALNRLQTAFFLISGDTCPCPHTPESPGESLTSAIRTLYWEELNLYAACGLYTEHKEVTAQDKTAAPAVSLCRSTCGEHVALLAAMLESLLN